jgi:hypothetical protein
MCIKNNFYRQDAKNAKRQRRKGFLKNSCGLFFDFLGGLGVLAVNHAFA